VGLKNFFSWMFNLFASHKRIRFQETDSSKTSEPLGFWDTGPHKPIPVEETFQQFIRQIGGEVISDLVPKSPLFKNADFLFKSENVILELKEVETEFTKSEFFLNGLDKLCKRLFEENPKWKPYLFGGSEDYPTWFSTEYIRLLRPQISRILKKANKQLRETKQFFGINRSSGILIFVNDGFTGIDPDFVQSIACGLLVNDYSSIDCFLYLTVNRYIAIQGSDVPRIVWCPTYSDRAEDSLVDFVDDLGRKWFQFLDEKIGPFAHPGEETQDRSVLSGSKSIVIPQENPKDL
jgi:hypothetical protein